MDFFMVTDSWSSTVRNKTLLPGFSKPVKTHRDELILTKDGLKVVSVKTAQPFYPYTRHSRWYAFQVRRSFRAWKLLNVAFASYLLTGRGSHALWHGFDLFCQGYFGLAILSLKAAIRRAKRNCI